MAKTTLIQCLEISQWDNVASALFRAARGKSRSPQVQQALANAEQTIHAVSSALAAARLPEGRFDAFVIHDPKQRLIHAAPFIDRIAHHAVVHHLEPVFERVLLPSVFACRPGKGVHRAIRYAQKQFRRFRWVMHVDIRHYFPNIDHAVLGTQLARRFRGDGLKVLNAIIDSYRSAPGKGLPIGALTSQHFANHYLGVADRWCLAAPGIGAHCRYMDDFLLWSDDKAALLTLRATMASYLADELKLAVKPPLIQRCRQGIQFCGIQICPFQLRPSVRRRRRFKQARQQWEKRWQSGEIDSLRLQQAYDAVRTILLPANAHNFLQRDLQQRAAPNV